MILTNILLFIYLERDSINHFNITSDESTECSNCYHASNKISGVELAWLSKLLLAFKFRKHVFFCFAWFDNSLERHIFVIFCY